MPTQDYSYIGSGKIRIREYGSLAGLIEVGNCSKLDFGVTEDEKSLKDFTQPGGGTYNSVSRISAVEISFTAHDISPANLARALYGSTAAVATGAVVAEPHAAYKGAFVKTDFLPSAIGVVTNTAGTTTYVLDTDYTVDVGGINILDAGAIPDSVAGASNIKITYTKAATDVVQALVASGKEYEIVFIGLNEARSGKASVVDSFRVKLSAGKNISLIGDDYGALEFTGKSLKDATKTGGGVSQYFKAEIEK